MHIRPYDEADLPAVVELTVGTFRPFFEDHVRPLYGEELFRAHHGRWEQDYRDDLPTRHHPAAGRAMAVAEVDGRIAGLVAWSSADRPDHGHVYLLAVAPPYRRGHVGRDLCRHALDALTAAGVRVVEIGTGGDPFHAPARALYESLGFTKVEIAGYIKEV